MTVVLAVGAHPDDIELGCAGTLVLHKLHGDKVYLLVLTKGEASGDAEDRERECRKAAEILGADGLFFGGLEDTKVHDGRETINAIEEIIDKVNPNIVYAPDYKDTHQDHRNAGHATLSAARRCKMILLYECASTQRDFCPQVFVNIEKTFDVKKKATLVFGSQMKKATLVFGSPMNEQPLLSRFSLAVKAIEGLAKFRGYQAGVNVAEAFEVGKFIFEI